jgi:hypothetical protein
MALPRFIVVSALAILFLYGLSAVASSAVYRLLSLDRQLDTGSRSSDFFFGALGANAVIYNRLPLVRTSPQVILIGASNMQHFAANDIAFEMPDVTVHNMSVSGIDLDDFALIVDLAYQALPRRRVVRECSF